LSRYPEQIGVDQPFEEAEGIATVAGEVQVHAGQGVRAGGNDLVDAEPDLSEQVVDKE